MIYSCMAFFYLNDQTQTCHVEIPEIGIDYEIVPEKWDKKVIISEAKRIYEDALFALSLGDGGIEIAGLADATSAYDFREEFTADLEELKARRKVVWEMKFDDQS